MPLSADIRGLLLAGTTVLFWGTLPIALKQVIGSVDVFTIVWLRFTTAALWLWFSLPHRAEGRILLPLAHPDRTRGLRLSAGPYSRRRTLLCLLTAICGLGANFVLYNASLCFLTASACQIVGQSGPMLLMLGGVLVLREPVRRVQIVGIPVLLLGFTLFFNQHLGELADLRGDLLPGLFLGLTAALVWSVYGVVQKILLREMAPQRILRTVYTGVALGLFPLASPSSLLRLPDLFQTLCLAYCCLNTMVAYGCFTRAMVFWSTPRVSAVLTLTPLATLFFAQLLHFLVPGLFQSEALNLTGYAGACVTVCGALLIAVGPALRFLRKD